LLSRRVCGLLIKVRSADFNRLCYSNTRRNAGGSHHDKRPAIESTARLIDAFFRDSEPPGDELVVETESTQLNSASPDIDVILRVATIEGLFSK
jgi:hypothetical protein